MTQCSLTTTQLYYDLKQNSKQHKQTLGNNAANPKQTQQKRTRIYTTQYQKLNRAETTGNRHSNETQQTYKTQRYSTKTAAGRSEKDSKMTRYCSHKLDKTQLMKKTEQTLLKLTKLRTNPATTSRRNRAQLSEAQLKHSKTTRNQPTTNKTKPRNTRLQQLGKHDSCDSESNRKRSTARFKSRLQQQLENWLWTQLHYPTNQTQQLKHGRLGIN